MRYLRFCFVLVLAVGLLACGEDPALTTDLYEYPGDADPDGGDVIADDVERVVVDPHDFTLEFYFEVDPRNAATECRIQDGDWFDCESPFTLDQDSEVHQLEEGYLLFDVRAYQTDDDERLVGDPDSIETLVLFDFDFWIEDLDEYDEDAASTAFGFPDEYEAICTRDQDYDGE